MVSDRLHAGTMVHVFSRDVLEKFRIFQILKQRVRIL